MDAEKEGLLTDMEVTQICASRSRVLGQYHMMTGMNPVYIISAGGRKMASGILITAISSGSGKTAAACALMAAYQAQNKKYHPVNATWTISIRCFHKEVLGVNSKIWIYSFLKDELRKEYAKHAADAELCYNRRRMGYYDGMRSFCCTASHMM